MKHPNVRTIGLFVTGAFALGVAALLAFGSTSWFEHRPRAVTFFHGSVAGLAVGAPVTFRGVRVGTVADIAVQINAGTGTAHIPVIMEFDRERMTVTGGDNDAAASKMLANGLGASLVMQSLVTGQLSIELDYYPEKDEFLTGIDLHLPEIPEARGGLSAMKETFNNLPLQELADNVVSALRSLRELLADPEIKTVLSNLAETSKTASETAATARTTLQHMDAMIGVLEPQLNSTLTSLNHVLANTDHLLSVTDQRTAQLSADLHATLTNAQALIAPRAELTVDMTTLLRNLAAASGSLRSFADQIDRNPNALVVGRSLR